MNCTNCFPRIFPVRFFLALLALLLVPGQLFAAPASQRILAETAPTEQPVMRGVFVDAFGTQFRDHLSTTRLARQLQDFQVQHCFMQVALLGEAYYDSKVLPHAAGLAVGYKDPLADLLKLYKVNQNQSGKVIAWITPLQSHNERTIVTPQENHVSLKHPEWLTKDVEGNRADSNGWVYLDPGHPEVQDYIASIVRELVKSYEIDGVLIDGLSYPEQGSRFGYNETALERFRKDTGTKDNPDPIDPTWLDWRRSQLTGLMARITREVKEAKPELIVAVTALANGPAPKTMDGFKFSQPYMASLQDWVTWGEFGMADWMILQNFADEQTERRRFDEWTAFAVANKGQSRMWVAVAGYLNWAIDAFRQIQRARINDVDGVAIYNFRQPVRDIATTDDFFAAVRALTLLSDRETASATFDLPGLRDRLQRMAGALERPQVTPAPDVIAPGVEKTMPAPTQPATRAVATETSPVRPPFFAPWDRVYLSNKTTFEGHKIGEMNGESIFETQSGVIIKINNQYIERIRPGE